MIVLFILSVAIVTAIQVYEHRMQKKRWAEMIEEIRRRGQITIGVKDDNTLYIKKG